MCKTHRTQNFCAPRHSWYSFRGIWRPIQPSHLKNHELHFFTTLPTKPSSYAVVHRPTWPCAKTHRTQNFRAPRLSWYSFGGIWRPIQPSHLKNHEFQFLQNSTPSHIVMPWCIDNLGLVQNPPNSKLLCTKTFMVFIWGHLEAFRTITSQKPRISFFHKTPYQAAMPWCTDNLGHVQNPQNSKLSCTNTFKVFI